MPAVDGRLPEVASGIQPPLQDVAIDDERTRNRSVALSLFQRPDINENRPRCRRAMGLRWLQTDQALSSVIQEHLDAETSLTCNRMVRRSIRCVEVAHGVNDRAPMAHPQTLPEGPRFLSIPSSAVQTLHVMPSPSARVNERPHQWDRRYSGAGATGVSWYQPEPAMSLALIDRLRVPKGAPVVDVGGGASLLVDRLVARGYTDLTVLDVSSTALEIARRRLGDTAPVRWLHEDLLSWQPERRYALWHDRAVFHFLTDAAERAKYLSIVRQTLGDSGALIIATFASDGPERCSGLPVARYDAEGLERLLDGFTVVESSREEHMTPGGTLQPFTWIAATCDGAQASS